MSFYAFLPLASGISALGLGIFVFFSNKQAILNRLFFLFTFCVSIWLLGTFLMFISLTDEQRIFWDRIGYLGVVLIPITLYHFGIVFTDRKTQKALLYAGYALSALFLLTSQTNLFVDGLYSYEWGYHTQARSFHSLFLVFFVFYVSLFALNIYRHSLLAKGLDQTRTRYVLLFAAMIPLGAFAFLPAYGINLPPFSYLAGVGGTLILAYAILKYQLMEIKVFLTEMLVAIIVFLLLLQFFTAQSAFEYSWKGGLLVAFLAAGYLLIKNIMNEIKQREELERTYAKLKELDQAKSEFISIASHQLRTPLTAIKGYISMILEGSYGTLNGTQEGPMKSVFESNERLIRLVNDLLNISRIESGRIDMKWEKKNIEDVIKGVIEEIGIKAQEKKLKLVFEKPEEPIPQVNLDEEKIRNVLLNILDNAIRYTKKGKITIRAYQKQKQEDSQKNGGVVVEVKDTGDGMTQEELSHLFESFSRGGAGTRVSTEGAGLGLYIAKQFMKLHNGKIWAESQGKGEGSTFFIELPLAV